MAKLAPSQIEQLHSIGAHLRQVRQEKDLSLDTLANQIFIRPVLLQALEAGNDAELPEPVFVQGFIRRYADALGLDGQALSHEFAITPVDVLPTPDLLEQVVPNSGVEPETRHSIRVLEKAEAPAPLPKLPGKSPLPLIAALVALGLALGLGIWGITSRNQAPSTARPTAVNNPVGTTPITTDPVDPGLEPLDEPIDETSGIGLAAPVVVEVNLRDRSWLSVTADGESVFEGTSEEGFQETWTAEDTLVLTTGNAGGVEISINGDEAVLVGDDGDVITLTITPDSDADIVLEP